MAIRTKLEWFERYTAAVLGSVLLSNRDLLGGAPNALAVTQYPGVCVNMPLNPTTTCTLKVV